MAKANQKAKKYVTLMRQRKDGTLLFPDRVTHLKKYPVPHKHYTRGDTGYIPLGNRNK